MTAEEIKIRLSQGEDSATQFKRFVGESTPPQGVNMPPRGVNMPPQGVNTPSWGVNTPPNTVESGGINQESGGIKSESGGINQESGGIKSESGGIKYDTESQDKTLLDVVAKHPGSKVDAIQSMTGFSYRSIERSLARLIESKKIEYRGSKKIGGYYILEEST